VGNVAVAIAAAGLLTSASPLVGKMAVAIAAAILLTSAAGAGHEDGLSPRKQRRPTWRTRWAFVTT